MLLRALRWYGLGHASRPFDRDRPVRSGRASGAVVRRSSRKSGVDDRARKSVATARDAPVISCRPQGTSRRAAVATIWCATAPNNPYQYGRVARPQAECAWESLVSLCPQWDLEKNWRNAEADCPARYKRLILLGPSNPCFAVRATQKRRRECFSKTLLLNLVQ